LKTCKEHVIEAIGKEKGDMFVSEFCPSAFGFDDHINGYHCGEEHGCTKCWETEQEIPEDFDKLCEENVKGLEEGIKDDEEEVELVKNVYTKVELTKDDVIEPLSEEESVELYKKILGVEEPRILDSGDRTEFESGAVRDMRVGKGRCDLLPLDVVRDLMPGSGPQSIFDNLNGFQETGDITFLNSCLWLFAELHMLGGNSMLTQMSTLLLEVAIHFEEGAKKYGDNNWRKGVPVRCYIDSAIRHYLKWLRGDKDEPHDRAFCWNILCAIWTCIHIPELNEYRSEENEEQGMVENV
jgi:hypothetical protein